MRIESSLPTKYHHGVTLIELMVSLIILAVLVTLAVPSFQETMQRSRLLSDADALSGDLQFARSEAIKRRLPVSLCASLDHARCNTAGFAGGWLIFVDYNEDGIPQTGTGRCQISPTLQEDCVLRQHGPIDSNNQLLATPNISALVFQSDGSIKNLDQDLTLQLCAKTSITDRNEKLFTVSPAGYLAVEPRYTCTESGAGKSVRSRGS